MITNLVVALMIVSNGLEKVTALPVTLEPNPCGIGNSSMVVGKIPYIENIETLYRKVCVTNYVYLDDIKCIDARKDASHLDIRARAMNWGSFCNCPCHKNGCK